MGEEDCRINEGAGSSGVDQRQQRDGELARNDQMKAEGQVARGGMRKRNGEGESTAQPDPYCWLGRSFFGRVGGAGRAGGGTWVQGVGKEMGMSWKPGGG